MPKNLSQDQENGLDEGLNSRFQEIQKDHGGKFLAMIDSDETIVEDNYVELLRELENKGMDFETVTITNVPRTKD